MNNELSIFIEQDINDATVGDIYVEQAMAEFNVASAILDAYIKECYMMEYATEPSEFCVFQEAADDSDEKGDKKKEGNWFKRACAAIVAFFKALPTNIKNFVNYVFKTSHLEKCVKKLEDFAKEEKISLGDVYVNVAGTADDLDYYIGKGIPALLKVWSDKMFPEVFRIVRAGTKDDDIASYGNIDKYSNEILRLADDLNVAKKVSVDKKSSIHSRGGNGAHSYSGEEIVKYGKATAELRKQVNEFEKNSKSTIKQLDGIAKQGDKSFGKRKDALGVFSKINKCMKETLSRVNAVIKVATKFFASASNFILSKSKKELKEFQKTAKKNTYSTKNMNSAAMFDSAQSGSTAEDLSELYDIIGSTDDWRERADTAAAIQRLPGTLRDKVQKLLDNPNSTDKQIQTAIKKYQNSLKKASKLKADYDDIMSQSSLYEDTFGNNNASVKFDV